MTLLTDVWGNQPRHVCIVGIRGEVVKHFWTDDATKAGVAAERLATNGWDAYWAPALFADTTRKADQVQSVGAFWIDVDAGAGKEYADANEAARAVLDWVHQHGLPNPTHIVSSGGGLHFYWALDRFYSRHDWLPVAQRLKRALVVGKVVDDPGCTGDAARILRVPGTYNYKGDEAAPVKLLVQRAHRPTLEQIATALPQLGPQQALPSGPRPDSEWGVPTNYPLGDAARIADSCAQMGQFRHFQGAVSEPYWRAGLSVLKRCEGGEVLIHEWSKGDPRYNAPQTQKKADATLGPATCAHFGEVNPGGCAGCPYAGKVTSPVQLGVAAPDPAPDAPDWRIAKSGGWVITDGGIYRNPPATDDDPSPEPIQATDVPLWVVEVREKARLDTEADQASLLLAWRTLDGREKKGVMYQSSVADSRAFRQWLADHNLYSAVRSTKELGMYISNITRDTIKKRGVREYHETLGWHQGGFVVGDTIVTKDGPKDALVQSSNPISRIHPQGDAATWTAAVDRMDDPNLRVHQVGVLAGFASPLYELAHTQSAVLSLVGRSGAGKTLAARIALSIYGDPEALAQGSSSTANSVENQLATLKHVPHLLDEVTNLPTHRITDHIYMAANGQGKGSLTRNRQVRAAGSWALSPIITSNHPVLEFGHDQVQEAHRRRLLELHCDTVFPPELGAELYEVSSTHAGAVGIQYLQRVAALRESIPTLFNKALERVQSWGRVPPENRFGLWTLAACLLGGQIARSAGLIHWDPEVALKEAISQLHVAIEDTLTDDARAVTALADYLNDYSRYVTHWADDGQDLGEDKDAVVARWYNKCEVALHQRKFHDYLRELRIPRAASKSFLDRVTIKSGTRRLTPGGPSVRCIIIDAGRAGLLTEETDSKEE